MYDRLMFHLLTQLVLMMLSLIAHLALIVIMVDALASGDLRTFFLCLTGVAILRVIYFVFIDD